LASRKSRAALNAWVVMIGYPRFPRSLVVVSGSEIGP
jgi:hypothetical protein